MDSTYKDFLNDIKFKSKAERPALLMNFCLQNMPSGQSAVVEAAAVPRFFDEDYLNYLLDRKLDEKEFQELTSLSYVESPPDEEYFNIHESSRNLILDNFLKTNESRFRDISSRAAQYCFKQNNEDKKWRIEYIYHQLVANPAKGAHELIETGWQWQKDPYFPYDKIELLLRAVREHFTHWQEDGEELFRELEDRYESEPLSIRLVLLLILSAVLFANSKKKPNSLSSFYENAILLLLGFWQMGLEEQESLDLRKDLEKLAFLIQKNQAKNLSNLEEIVKNLPEKVMEYSKCQIAPLVNLDEENIYFLHHSFQEYLAACYILNSNRDNQIDMARLIEENFIHWKDVFIFVLKKKSNEQAITALQSLIPEGLSNSPGDYRKAMAVGLGLLELKLASAPECKDLYRQCILHLTKIVSEGALPSKERAEAGDVLGQLGDSRYGVKLDKDRLPDVSWIEIEGKWDIETFEMAQYPVNVAQYQAFIDAGGYKNDDFWIGIARDWRNRMRRTVPVSWKRQILYRNRPVSGVTWFEAKAFCLWLSKIRSWKITLPTEGQWKRAIRGKHRGSYPWGYLKSLNSEHANLINSGVRHPTSVGMYPQEAKEKSIYDLIGNIREWCRCSDENSIQGESDDNFDEDTDNSNQRYARGGSYYSKGDEHEVMETKFDKTACDSDFGFRLVRLDSP